MRKLSRVVFMLLLLSSVMGLNRFAHAQVAGETIPEEGGAITLDFKDADIKTVLRVMSLKSGVNIVAGPEVTGTVTVRLENVSWEKALDVILRTYGYVYERQENIVRVTTRENLALEPLATQVFILNYTKANEVREAVKDMLSERGRIQVAERTNTLIITDIPTNLYRIGEVIKKLDQVTPQAYIDSKVVLTEVGVAENLGIEWKTGGSNQIVSLSGTSRPTSFPFPNNEGRLTNHIRQFFPDIITGSNTEPNSENVRGIPQLPAQDTTSEGAFNFGTLDFSSFSTILQLLVSKSNTKVVSNPRIVVLNNQTATVQVGSDIPLPTFERNETTGSMEITGFSYREVGVVLNVTPHINSEEEILVDLQPEVSSKGDDVSFGDFQAPSFDVTKAVTQVLIRSGETIAIGGLLTDNVAINEARVPYLSDIPLIGKLFRSKRQSAGDSNTKSETLFFVTVTVVDTEGQPTGRAVEEKTKSHQMTSSPTPGQEKVATDNRALETQSQDVSGAKMPVSEGQEIQTV